MADYTRIRKPGEYCLKCGKDEMPPWNEDKRICGCCGWKEERKISKSVSSILPREGYQFAYCNKCKVYEEVSLPTMRLMHMHNGLLTPLNFCSEKMLPNVVELEQIHPAQISPESLSQ